MTREEKAQVVAELTDVIDKASGMYFTNFQGMSVLQANTLRAELRKQGIQYKVAKNTLIKLALEKLGKLTDDLSKSLVGQTGIAFGFEDPVAPARVLKEFTEKNADKPALKLAYLEGVTYPGSDLKRVAALPTKQEVMSSIVGSIAAPIAGLAGVLGALQRDIVYLMDAIEKQMQGATA